MSRQNKGQKNYKLDIITEEKSQKTATNECQTQISYYEGFTISKQTNPKYQHLKWKNANFKQQLMADTLDSIFFKRKRYSLQVLKQFYLFPDETISEDYSIDAYDRLIISDQPIHSFVKIYETKEAQTKIWAFLNIKMLHIFKKLTIFVCNIQSVTRRREKQQKALGFNFIRQFSIRINPTKDKPKIIRNVKSAEKNFKFSRPQGLRMSLAQQSYLTEPKIQYPQEKFHKHFHSPKTERNNAQTMKNIPYTSNHSPAHYTCIHVHGCCTINTCQPQVHNVHTCHNNFQPNNYHYVHNCQNYQHQIDFRYDIEERIEYLKKLEEIYEKGKGKK